MTPDEEEVEDRLHDLHDAVSRGDAGEFFLSAALVQEQYPVPEVRYYVERATALVAAQMQQEESPNPFRSAVLDGHASLCEDAYEKAINWSRGTTD